MRMDAKVTGVALFMAGNATVTGDVTIGKQVGIWFGAVVRADKDRIIIGDRSNIQDNCVVHTSKGFPVTLGTDVSVGHGAILHGCTIADQVLVGMGAIVLNGADIGADSIVAAGALVPEGLRIAPRSLVMGTPARVRRPLTNDEVAGIRDYAARYVAYRLDYMPH